MAGVERARITTEPAPYDRPGFTRRVPLRRFSSRRPSSDATDEVATEEPLEIRVAPHGSTRAYPIAVTMRTPGHDFELAAGFALSEGIARSPSDLRGLRYCTLPEEEQWYNVVTIDLGREADFDPETFRRQVYISSSCGICGRTALDRVRRLGLAPLPEGDVGWPAETLTGLADRLRAHQSAFARTGGLHATGVADAAGNVPWAREDVGRHNAFDKVLGHLALEGGLPASRSIAIVSGRASFELVQKAIVGGFPALAAVGAPSHLAVALAREFHLTLIGFLRGEGFNVYCGEERVR